MTKEQRDKKIFDLKEAGYSTADIAARFGLSAHRVARIYRQMKAASK